MKTQVKLQKQAFYIIEAMSFRNLCKKIWFCRLALASHTQGVEPQLYQQQHQDSQMVASERIKQRLRYSSAVNHMLILHVPIIYKVIGSTSASKIKRNTWCRAISQSCPLLCSLLHTQTTAYSSRTQEWLNLQVAHDCLARRRRVDS